MGSLLRTPRTRWTIAGLTTVVVIVGLLGLFLRRPTEVLTLERLQAAEQRWRASHISDYDMRIVVSGVQRGVHKIEVRDAKVTGMTTGGAEVARHVWLRWTIEGLFDFLREELANAEDPENTFGVSDPSRVILYAGFDEQTGYPRRFLRHVMGRQASVEWQVEEFQPVTSR